VKVLLDTHTFIWWDSEPSKLSARVLALLQHPETTVLLNVVSVWEMLIKQQLGKLTLRMSLTTPIAQQQSNGIQILPIALTHALAVESLPPVHKDPFDRLLVAQANVEGAVLASANSVFAQYPVNVVW